MRDRRLVGLVAVGTGLLASVPAAAQLRGVVTDSTGRPLPLVTVVSRTNNGFLASRTDARGTFAFPGRPHGAGHRIDVSTFGYRPVRYVLADGDSVVAIRMVPDRSARPAGWTSGLPIVVGVTLADTEGRPVDPASARGGGVYRAVITVQVRGACDVAGSPVTAISGDTVRMAVPFFVRGGPCADVADDVLAVPFEAPAAPTWLLLVAGRYRDVSLDIR